MNRPALLITLILLIGVFHFAQPVGAQKPPPSVHELQDDFDPYVKDQTLVLDEPGGGKQSAGIHFDKETGITTITGPRNLKPALLIPKGERVYQIKEAGDKSCAALTLITYDRWPNSFRFSRIVILVATPEELVARISLDNGFRAKSELPWWVDEIKGVSDGGTKASLLVARETAPKAPSETNRTIEEWNLVSQEMKSQTTTK